MTACLVQSTPTCYSSNKPALHFSERDVDEEDSEEVFEERMLSQDVAGLKGRHWRDPEQGFVNMTSHTKQSGTLFSLTVLDVPGNTTIDYNDCMHIDSTLIYYCDR